MVIPNQFLRSAALRSLGTGFPSDTKYNMSFLEATGLEKAADILRLCGVRRRFVLAPGETTDLIATEAAQCALKSAGMSAEDIRLIICANTVRQDLASATASLIQRNLSAKKAAVFDLVAACTGFVKALEVAVALIDGGFYPNVLVCAVETPSLLHKEKPKVAMLFGDGAGAAVLTRSDEPKHWVFSMYDDGDLWHLMQRPLFGDTSVVFNGHGIFRAAVEMMVRNTTDVLHKANVSLNDIKLVVPHQANSHITDAVARKLGLTDKLGRVSKKVVRNLERYGNTSAASIPIALNEAVDKAPLNSGDLILMTAFGAGATSGAAIMEW